MASPTRLGAGELRALADPRNDVFVSSVTVWEIAIKRALGRLTFPVNEFDEMARRMGFDTLPIMPSHAIAAGDLPPHHADPFDRMLIAQAVVENLLLVTSDHQIGRYDVRIFGR